MSNRRSRPLLRVALVAGLVIVLAAVLATVTGNSRPAQPDPPPGASPLPSPTGLFVDPTSPAARQVQQWDAEGRAEDARRIGALAAQPVPLWLTADTDAAAAETADYVRRADAVGQEPFLVAYRVPHRDCGSFSGGGADDAADYRSWIRGVAASLGGRRATVVVEPDAVPHELSGCVQGGQVEERYDLLADAVEVLKASGPVTVYLDAGNPGFISDVPALATALRRSGVDRADGFSLNVANFWTTEDNVEFGRRLSNALGGAHFVVDTSRNGNGRVEGETVDGGPTYCNPPGRVLGRPPMTETGDPLVDAFLWVKRVGESDGPCRSGEPAAGQWWPDYALALAPA